MAYIDVLGINSYYEKSGSGKKIVVLLHGWGQNTLMMKNIADFLSQKFTVYNFDFPGFGKSDLPNKPYGCEEYCLWLIEIFNKLRIENPIIIAHSFGCRIAFHYASKHKVLKMCLTGAAGLKPILNKKQKFKIALYKKTKKLLLFLKQKKLLEHIQKRSGSLDYRNAKGVMKESFVKVVNDDVRVLLPKINVETLLVFGEKDSSTPVCDGKIMEKMMPNATLVIFENDDHYAYFNQAHRFNLVLDAFLKGEYDE